MNDDLREAVNMTQRDAYETVSVDRARHALQFLQETVEEDATVAQATVEDMITVLEDLVG
ncbi:hypothetical protein [Acetobacter okinawensis]|uniref:Uncharacterized protein n=1 Tax=Acetobacter okinawensis TaxID=1076594 RepID=A0A252BRA5_9PROT|nr:hypothetical protein [Acetobacter okinawensis]OUJ10148.1 hypothetical protein HK26_11595 [Acetobacter okinawensis]